MASRIKTLGVTAAPFTIAKRKAHFSTEAVASTTTAPPGNSSPALNAQSNQHFYHNKTLDDYVNRKPTPITLRQLMFYERHLQPDRLLKSANYVRQELPIRISHRIREFQKLPFIVGTNPHVQNVYDLYWHAFEHLRRVPPIQTLEDNQRFCQTLAENLEAHLVVIPRLALGMSECGQHMNSDAMDRFMNASLRSRISRRTLAEQHLALTRQHHEDVVSSVFRRCSARALVQQCATLVRAHHETPEIAIHGDDISFTYIHDHIQYILYQLLSNAMRHTLSTEARAPVHVTIASNTTDVYFRVSDRGGGMAAPVFSRIWSYGQRPHNLSSVSQLAARATEHDHLQIQLGIGLPMSRVYAEYLGGNLSLMTMDGYGTDAYVRIPLLGTQNENIDVDSPTTTHSRIIV